MNLIGKIPAIAVTLVVVGGVAGFVWDITSGPKRDAPLVVKVPSLSAQGKTGEAAFAENCAACHGRNAGGGDKGPPLVHNIYNPGHHADAAFFLAAKKGVRRHHWRFGNMPPLPNVRDKQIADIVRYVRELQAANGITYKPHNM